MGIFPSACFPTKIYHENTPQSNSFKISGCLIKLNPTQKYLGKKKISIQNNVYSCFDRQKYTSDNQTGPTRKIK